MFTSGIIVESRQVMPGAYHVRQVVSGENLHDQLRGSSSKDRYRLHAAVGVVTISGYLDGLTLEAAVQVNIFGINLGTFHGNPEEQPFTIEIDLEFVKGNIQLQTRDQKDQNELWLHVDTVVLQLDPTTTTTTTTTTKEIQIQSVPCTKSILLRSLPQLRCEPWIPVPDASASAIARARVQPI